MKVPEKIYIQHFDSWDNERIVDSLVELADKINEVIDCLETQKENDQ